MPLAYENQLIGVFLFGLGVATGRAAKSRPIQDAVSLLQQGPMDKPLGDLLLGNATRGCLIEFKRSRKTIDSENEKREGIARHIFSRAAVEVQDAATTGHLLCYPQPTLDGEIPLQMYPYFNSTQPMWKSFSTFANAYLLGQAGARATPFRTYINELLKLANASSGSGIIVTTDSKGQIVFQSVARLSDLKLTVSQHLGMTPPGASITQSIPPPSQGRGMRM